MTVLLNFSAVGASCSPTAHLQLNHYTTSHSSNLFKAEGIFIVPKGQHVVQPQTIGILKAQNSIIRLLVLNFIINTVSLAFLRQHELSTLEYVGSARTDFFFFFFFEEHRRKSLYRPTQSGSTTPGDKPVPLEWRIMYFILGCCLSKHYISLSV